MIKVSLLAFSELRMYRWEINFGMNILIGKLLNHEYTNNVTSFSFQTI